MLGHLDADHIIHPRAQLARRLPGGDRHRQDHTCRTALAQRACGRLRAATGRKSIIDEQHRSPRDRKPRALALIASQSLGPARAARAPRPPQARPRSAQGPRTASPSTTLTSPSASAPIAYSGFAGAPSLRTTTRSSGASSARATSAATGTPPRGCRPQPDSLDGNRRAARPDGALRRGGRQRGRRYPEERGVARRSS